MDPKYAPYKCPCGTVSWNSRSFWLHLEDCPEARDFFAIYKKLQKIYLNAEDYV